MAEDLKSEFRVKGEDLIRKVKDLVHEGNVRRIIIKDEQGKTYFEVPLTLGVVGAVLMPGAASSCCSRTAGRTLELRPYGATGSRS